MQIKRISEEVEGVTHLEIRDVKVKDKLFKVSVSRNHVVSSCKKFVMCGIVSESGTSSDSVSVSNDYFKMQQTSLKLTEIWFDFRQAVNKARVQSDRLEYVHKTIKQLNTDLDNQCGDFVEFTKKDHMAAMLGKQPVGKVSILVPNI
ncbi:hypothetical protein POM88_018269 [Heracleum sosnowskyi]|uniref:Uncharacterized protein n=1 Tax=Heracleum sosnowskyi TaxID=360622 RepID=A0AAD8MZ03_9APIA|nr:hypothetical protein POM88_018269 [Heracleum sosnowskyi]